jgi:hypothetical protein
MSSTTLSILEISHFSKIGPNFKMPISQRAKNIFENGKRYSAQKCSNLFS